MENVREIEKLRSKLLQRANDYDDLKEKYIELKTSYKIFKEKQGRDQEIAKEHRQSATEYLNTIKEMDEKLLIL